MKSGWILVGIILLAFAVFAIPVSADGSGSSTTSSTSSTSTSSSSSSTTTSTIDQSALVTVTNVTMDTQSYAPYDYGTLTVTLTNSGTDAIGLYNPQLISTHVSVVDADEWEGMSFVGAGSSISYSIRFQVNPPDGCYFALFTLNTQNGNAIDCPIKIEVNSNDLMAAVTSKPTSFAPEAEQNVTLTLLNTRQGMINNVVVTPEGDGIDADPATVLVPCVASSSSADIVFGITPHQASNLTFNISYQNGDNTHYTNVFLPINIGQDKTAAVPVLNDVAMTTAASDYDITGDITNAGISDAYGVIVNVGSPATGTGTYPVYAIGSIASDDSGTFELTFNAPDLSAVPVIISWKDAVGNDYSMTKTLNLGSSTSPGNSTVSSGTRPSAGSGTGNEYGAQYGGGSGGMNRGGYGGRSSSTTSIFGITGGRGGGVSAFYPLIAGAILVVAGIVIYTKRKWIALKLKRQQ